MGHYKIRSGTWEQLKPDATLIRQTVFIDEQAVPAVEEWDAQDSLSQHYVVYADQQPIATARLLQNNSIGRVAVLKAYRGAGIGRLLMQDILQQAKIEQRESLKLSAQVHAIPFYASLGFSVQGTEYLDCGIPHVDMTMSLKATSH